MSARKWERGVALPETAIIMTVLLVMMFGIIDFGRMLYTYSFVAQLARQGARWAIVRGAGCTVLDHCNPTSSDVQTYVQSLNEGAMNASSITATLQTPGGNSTCSSTGANNAAGCVATVTVRYPFSFMLPWMPGNTITMSSSSQMIIAN